MKKLTCLFAVIALVFAAIPALAASGGAAFPLFSSASGTVRNSSVYNVSGYKVKSLAISGATLESRASSTTYKNMSGTVLVQCAPTSGGPWSTCIANDYGQTAVSRTTNGIFTWTDSFPYIRLNWTGGTKGGKLKAWLNWLE